MPLNADEQLKFKKNSKQLVPSAVGKPAGWVLTKIADEPGGYDWRHPPQKQVLELLDSPDTVVSAPFRTLAVVGDGTLSSLWQNDDGQTAWHEVGSGATLLTDSYYEYVDDTNTAGKTQTAGDVANKWTASGLSGFNQGSDVTLSSGVVTIVNTGVYSIAATWEPKADTAADLYNYARGRFTLDRTNEPGSPSHDQVFLDDVKFPAVNVSDNKHIASFSVAVTAFMFAGDQVICESRFESTGTAGSTWSINTASMYIERLA